MAISVLPRFRESSSMRKISISFLAALCAFSGALTLSAQTIPLMPERGGHAATLLNSGKVLITGGANEGGTLKSALLYDPVANVFTATGAMLAARGDHTSILLPDGRVLITGGANGTTVLQTAEIYDPVTGKFTLTAQSMSTARNNHAAVLLWDGTVLVHGGGTADIFNPANDSFTPTPGTPINRKSHMVTPLQDGTVLITGGYVNGISSNSAEIYNVVTKVFTVLGSNMNIARANHTATLLPSGQVLITGGFSGTSPHAQTELYDPVLQTFTLGFKMANNRSNHRAILQGDGRVVVIGGVTLESGFLAADEVYTPSTGMWTAYQTMLENRGGHTATMLQSGKILVAGGVTGNETLQSAEILDPVTHNFTAIGNMITGRNQHRATLLNDGKVLLAAGSNNAFNLKSAELFDPTNNTFSAVGSLKDSRKSQTATKLQDGRVLVAGGKGGGAGDLTSAEIYDPSTQLFHLASPMNEERALHSATLLNNGEVLVVGGVQTGGTTTETTELFDPSTESFSLTGSLNLGRKRHRAALLNDGTLLVEGGNYLANGTGGGDRETETAELYTPATALWSMVGDMSSQRSEHESTLLEDGTVLISGGILIPVATEIYHPMLQSFSDVGQMIQTRGRHVAIRLANPAWGSLVGQVVAIGGDIQGGSVFGGGQQAFDSVEIFDPATNQWASFGTMTEARQNHTATELNDGRIMIAGGVGRPFISATGELLDGPTPSPTPIPTPTPTPSPTISPSPTPTPTPSPSPSPSPSPTASPSPTPSPTPVESKPLNISTRGDAQTGDKVLIGGFIVTGGTEPKTVILRAIGPSLPLDGVLADPVLELHNPDGSVVLNDNWKDTQQTAIAASGLAPTNDLESAIIATLEPGLYTAIVRGKDDGTGLGLVEVYDLDDPNSPAYLANISTRGFAQPGDNAMIGGFIIGDGDQTGQVVVRAIGPSLTSVPDALSDPTLNLFDVQGTLIGQNDDWADTNGAAIESTGLAPTDSHESAILADLAPGAYTAIVQGKSGGSGVGLVEVYYLR